MRTLFLAMVLCAAAYSQAANAISGVTSEWDVRAMLTNLEAQARGLGPALDQMKPDMWTAKGASPTYAVQWKTAKNEVEYLVGSSQALTKDPERLTFALDTLFRMQALDRTLASLVQAMRKYQNAALADALQTRLGESSVSRDKLRLYVMDLARQKEHEYVVMDSEAQRCRGSLAGARSGTVQRRKNAAQLSEQK
jgi:hypothetical protein